MRDFKQKVVVITGASGNLGLALCQRFAEAGARVVALDLQADMLARLKAYLQSKNLDAHTQPLDVTDKKACESAILTILSEFGKIDVLINNAGITHIQTLRQMDKERDTVRRVMEVNLLGAVYLTQAALESLIAHKGLIINTSSVAGFAPLWGRTAYAASKHALHGFFESLRSELVADGVGCLMVCPSFITAQSPIADLSDSPIYQDKKTTGKPIYPSFAADEVYKAACKNKRLLIIGKTGKMAYWLSRLFPSWYEKMMLKRIAGR